MIMQIFDLDYEEKFLGSESIACGGSRIDIVLSVGEARKRIRKTLQAGQDFNYRTTWGSSNVELTVDNNFHNSSNFTYVSLFTSTEESSNVSIEISQSQL